MKHLLQMCIYADLYNGRGGPLVEGQQSLFSKDPSEAVDWTKIESSSTKHYPGLLKTLHLETTQ